MENKSEFVAAAIADIQSTIRAIDVKVAALLVGILAPLTNTGRIFAHLANFSNQSPNWFFLLLSIIFILAWFLSLIALARAISAIDNPSAHITNASDYKGSFYAGGLFTLGLLDVFLNRDIVKASKDPKSFSLQIPKTKTEIEQELIFEQMKLVYIRDTKMLRLDWGMRFALAWLLLGITIYISSKFIFH